KSYEAGQFQEAAGIYQRALAPLERAFGRLDPDHIRCLQRLADCQYAGQEYDSAIASYYRLFSIGQEVLGKNHPDVMAMAAKVSEITKLKSSQTGFDRKQHAAIDDRASRLSHSSIKALRPEDVDAVGDWRLHHH